MDFFFVRDGGGLRPNTKAHESPRGPLRAATPLLRNLPSEPQAVLRRISAGRENGLVICVTTEYTKGTEFYLRLIDFRLKLVEGSG